MTFYRANLNASVDLVMALPVSVCPVPEEQQPLNEYTNLVESWFYRWATLKLSSYITPILWLWVISWLIAGPIAAYSFSPQKHLVQFMLCGIAGANGLVGLPLLLLYFGWRYVGDRLSRETVSYEESGWYDGQTWQKPSELITRDRLIVTYQIRPWLVRLQRTFILLLTSLIGCSVICTLL